MRMLEWFAKFKAGDLSLESESKGRKYRSQSCFEEHY